MKQVTLIEHIERIKETAKEDIFHVLFTTDKTCSSCDELLDVIKHELDTPLFPEVEFCYIDCSRETTPFMTIAVPGIIVHHRGGKFVETIAIPVNSRGHFYGAGIEEFLHICIREKRKLENA